MERQGYSTYIVYLVVACRYVTQSAECINKAETETNQARSWDQSDFRHFSQQKWGFVCTASVLITFLPEVIVCATSGFIVSSLLAPSLRSKLSRTKSIFPFWPGVNWNESKICPITPCFVDFLLSLQFTRVWKSSSYGNDCQAVDQLDPELVQLRQRPHTLEKFESAALFLRSELSQKIETPTKQMRYTCGWM